MTYFSTCHGCAVEKAKCPTRRALMTAIKGRNVSSLKHKCAAREPIYGVGDPVFVLTTAWIGGDEEPPRRWFPGVFIKPAKTQAVCFVAAGATADDKADEVTFEPSGLGFIKAPFSRIKARPGDPTTDVTECVGCGYVVALLGHDRDCPMQRVKA